ncbi:MAG: nucleoside 2-deoxyribosyltransferase domain-containing protein [bacterium]
MKIITPDHKDTVNITNKKSVFLAGPTPRSSTVKSWRPEVINEFKKHNFNGILFVPETDFTKQNYIDQIEWEDNALHVSICILFWIPRNLETMPGFTTNIEFGEWMKSGKVILGYPPKAEKMRYLKEKAFQYNIPISHTIEETVYNTILYLKKE